MRRTVWGWARAGLCALMAVGVAGALHAQAQEEKQDYFKKWLTEDVVYIISPEEKEIFEKLTTEEEKENFIEQFWFRRDPDPRTAANEYKEEHYRRIAYANERFQSGTPGWKSDRGRVYIAHGPPDEIVSYPSGGPYLRQPHEGGGQTSTYPFEVWRYRYIEGIGDEVELEFVDRTWAGEYRLTMDVDEKDALMRVPNAGLTLAEQLGRAGKRERPFFQPGNRERYPLRYQRAKDSPFAKYELLAKAQSPPQLKYPDLKQVVEVNLSYDNLPTRLRVDYFQLNDEQVLAPITLEIPNQELTFKPEKDAQVAHVAVYGVITSINNRVVHEFEDDMAIGYLNSDIGNGRLERSTYQKLVTLERGLRHKLDLVVKDVNSGKIGVVRRGLAPPSYRSDDLAISSVVISDLIMPSRSTEEMFVLGDVKVRPSATNRFSTDNALGLYLQLYNVGIDQATQSPSMETRYTIKRDGRTVMQMSGETGEGMVVYGDQRVALVKTVPVDQLLPGRYLLEVEVRDRVKNQTVTAREQFDLTGPNSGPSE